ncbi:MAG TPA: folylpolyglutamate synthase/dihydrofolate synthase family protein [Rhodospirillales bacterium]|jgi:dihydrofolate synthase/folylpolyglutamate synthase|nr:folylpolyglutamate synthase/dihydrofolate synthase family protein [Rhodospirillales bacterium]
MPRRLCRSKRRKSPLSSDAVLDRLTKLHPKLIDLSLDRVAALLHRLGDPQDGLAPVVHVAGTNGKGSVIALLAACLEAAGFTVHVYTSPHLVRFNERIRVAGRVLADDALAALLEECETFNAGASVTFFEITTAAAFLAFARAPADVVLLETGLGGRLDATNMVARPRLTILTPIAMDHEHFLGDTLEAIAGEKAGILKSGVTCVSSAQHAVAARVIGARAATLDAPLLREGAEWTVVRDGDHLIFEAAGRGRRLPLPALAGAHQVHNAGTALAGLSQLAEFDVDVAAQAQGLSGVEWPGRLQLLSGVRLATLLPQDWELWLDGGHNPDAGKALAAHAREWSDRPLHLVIAMMETKDRAGFLRPLAEVAERVRCVAIPNQKVSLGAVELAAAARAVGMDAEPASDLNEALGILAGGGGKPARVLICGSLYFAGAVLGEDRQD